MPTLWQKHNATSVAGALPELFIQNLIGSSFPSPPSEPGEASSPRLPAVLTEHGQVDLHPSACHWGYVKMQPH